MGGTDKAVCLGVAELACLGMGGGAGGRVWHRPRCLCPSLSRKPSPGVSSRATSVLLEALPPGRSPGSTSGRLPSWGRGGPGGQPLTCCCLVFSDWIFVSVKPSAGQALAPGLIGATCGASLVKSTPLEYYLSVNLSRLLYGPLLSPPHPPRNFPWSFLPAFLHPAKPPPP